MPRPTRISVFFILSILLLALSPPSAPAATSTAKVALHVQAHATKASTICTSAAPTFLPCSQYTTRGDLGKGYDVYVAVGQADTLGVAGLAFGIDYDDEWGSGVDIVGPWFLCASGLEFPSNNWPAAGSGNILTWNTASCGTQNLPPDGVHGIAGAFYMYAYTADTFSITKHMLVQGDPILAMANCEGAQKDLLLSNVGSVEFSNNPNTTGFNPCLGSVSPTDFKITPATLNAASHGNWIAASVELPEGMDPADIVLSTVMLQGSIPAEPDLDTIGDFNENQIPDRTFKFNRTAFIMTLFESQETVEVVLTGDVLDIGSFTAIGSMRIVRPRMLSPNGGEVLIAGSMQEIRWNTPSGWTGTTADLYYSSDLSTWTPVATGIQGTRHIWRVPEEPTGAARLQVVISDEFGMLGSDKSDQDFSIFAQVTGTGPSSLPDVYALLQNAPNPFSASTSIQYELPAETAIALDIYDVSGRNVRRLAHRTMPAGRHEEVWDGRDDSGQRVASGIYFYRMKTADYQETKRLFVLR